jgi:hypothetical protein
VDNARKEWSKVSSFETECIEQALQQQNSSIAIKIQNGVAPQDWTLANIRFECRNSVGGRTQSTNDIQNISSKPTFDCSEARFAHAQILCLDAAGANADWTLNSASWAIYFSIPDGEKKRFDQDQQQFLDTLDRNCQIDAQQTMFAATQRQCVLNAYHARAARYPR